MYLYEIGDAVAVLSVRGVSPRETIAIGVVAVVCPDLIELEDGRSFQSTDGQCMTDGNCIVPATDEHRSREPTPERGYASQPFCLILGMACVCELSAHQ